MCAAICMDKIQWINFLKVKKNTVTSLIPTNTNNCNTEIINSDRLWCRNEFVFSQPNFRLEFYEMNDCPNAYQFVKTSAIMTGGFVKVGMGRKGGISPAIWDKVEKCNKLQNSIIESFLTSGISSSYSWISEQPKFSHNYGRVSPFFFPSLHY